MEQWEHGECDSLASDEASQPTSPRPNHWRVPLMRAQRSSRCQPEAAAAALTAAHLRRVRQRIGTRFAALILADAIALALAFLLASLPVYLFSPYEAARHLPDVLAAGIAVKGGQAAGFGLLLLLWLLNQGHYSKRMPFWRESRDVVAAILTALLADGFLQFALRDDFSRIWLVANWTLSIPLLLLGRHATRHILAKAGLWRIPALVVADSTMQASTAAELLTTEKLLGYDPHCTRTLAQVQAGWSGSWAETCREHGAEAIVLAGSTDRLSAHSNLISRLALDGMPFVNVQSLTGLPVMSLAAQQLIGKDVLLLVSESALSRPLGRLAKGLMDRLGAAILLVLCLPLLAVLAPLILRDGGPVLYSHPRVGRDGRLFNCLKLRTMRTDAAEALTLILDGDERRRTEWRTHRKLTNDPRITRLGRFLRTYSLDELPQLLNVLRGEMSLVGPRPVTVEEAAQFGDETAFYQTAKPGITGLWQVSGRNMLNYEERTRLNTWYAKNWSIWIDLVLLARTIPAVLRREGAQ